MRKLGERVRLGKRVKLVQQVYSNDCGIACLKMVSDFYGADIPLSFIRVLADPDQEGMSMYELLELAKEINLDGFPAEMTFDDFKNHYSDIPMPCILHWESNHFVVLSSIDSKGFSILDPALGKMRLSAKEFEKHWIDASGKGRLLLLHSSKENRVSNAFDKRSIKANSFSLSTAILKHLIPNKALVVRAVWSMLFILCIQLILPILMQAFIDMGIESQNFNAALIVMAAFVVLSASTLILQWFQNWMLLYIGSRLRVGLLYDFINSISKLPSSFFDKNFPADLMQRFGDHERIETFIRELSLKGFLVAISLLAFGLVLCFYQWLLMLVFLGFSILSTWIIIAFLPKRKMLDNQSFNISAEEQELMWEYVSNVDTVRMNGFTDELRNNWMQYQEKHLDIDKFQLKLSMYQEGGAATINLLRDTAISLIAAYLVIQGEMTLGSLIAVQFIVAQLNVSFQHVPALISTAQDAILSSERIETVRVFEERNLEPDIISDFQNMSLEGLNFAYKRTKDLQLRDINLVINKGDTLAIVGVSGCGKTSLLKILGKKYRDYDGKIVLNRSSELKKVDTSSFWQICSYTQADDPMFSISILDNIIMGNPLDMSWLKTCLDIVEMSEFVENLANGISTKLGPQGINLSLGQQQRILLARLIYAKPKLILIDEIPNALSEAQALRIMNRIKNAIEELTIVLCTHSRKLVELADHVLVLHDGAIVDQGKVEELDTRSLAFKSLFKE
jgi:ATP-binding cassette subfamily B protein